MITAAPSLVAMSFMSFAAEASSVLPDSAYHARVAREAADRGGYSFNAAAFPQLFDLDACARATIDLNQLTPLSLNQQSGRQTAAKLDDSCSSSSSSSSALAAPPAAATSSHVSSSSSGLELTMHESHSGNLIGSVVWEGGRVLAWVLETMHDRVRELKPDGSGFVEPQQPAGAAHSASSFTSPAYSEYLRAKAAGACFDLPRNFLVGARVLELGAGTGITGLACVKLGAAQVVLTDIETLKPLMAENVRRNCPGTLRNSQEWRPTARTIVATPAEAAVAAAPTAAAPVVISSAAPSSTVPSAALPSTSAASSFEYESCSNCDDLTIGLLRCSICDVALCDLCDASWHRPANKSTHQRTIGGIFAEEASASSSTAAAAASAASSAASSSSSSGALGSAAACMQPTASIGAAASAAPVVPAVAPSSSAAVPSYALPAHCDVYVEELLWGEQSSLSALPLSLRAPFDVIVMADVVYDAYATSGPGSEDCDNFRRLFATLCLLVPEGSNTTILLTYTPRRAPERAFFELLATAFLWCTYPATALLPAHEEGSVDDRIYIYHLHRSRMAGRVKQLAYIHQSAYGSEQAVERRIEQERKERRQKMEAQAASASSASSALPPPPMYVSASVIPATPPAPSRRPDSPDAASDAAAATAASAPVNITPTLTRYLENEEERQQAQLRAKLERRATQHTLAAQLASMRSVAPHADASHL